MGREFSKIFPSKSRPSSRAAFLFDWSGEPLWKSEFESVLTKTDELLGSNAGVPPDVVDRMDDLGAEESRPQTEVERVRDQALWEEYISTRPYLAQTPSAEAGRILIC